METELLNIEKVSPEEKAAALKKAGEIIREGGLVAFPTETVYGLGADALNAEASAKIYAAKGRPSDNPLIAHVSCLEEIAPLVSKGRPSDNPLIVHIHDVDQVYEIASEVPEAAKKVMEKFWPGPLTVILNKKSCVPDGTTGGLKTVAIRMPSHPLARDFIRESGRMIAAPSANTSGRPSPTLASHVYEDMQGRIPLILDGGAVGIGIESTIIDMSTDTPTILRPGYITKDMLEEVLPKVNIDPAVTGRTMKKNVVAKAPGMKYRHYAPKGQLTLVEGDRDKVIARINELVKEKEEEGHKVGVIGTDETLDSYHADILRSIGSRQKPETVAANLYRILREFDDLECDYMYSESFFEQGLGNAIMNRMLKAAGYHLITL